MNTVAGVASYSHGHRILSIIAEDANMLYSLSSLLVVVYDSFIAYPTSSSSSSRGPLCISNNRRECGSSSLLHMVGPVSSFNHFRWLPPISAVYVCERLVREDECERGEYSVCGRPSINISGHSIISRQPTSNDRRQTLVKERLWQAIAWLVITRGKRGDSGRQDGHGDGTGDRNRY